MDAITPNSQATPERHVVEWRPGRDAVVLWNLLAAPLLFVALVVYLRLATLRLGSSGSITIGIVALLWFLLLTVLLTAVVLAAHEGLHGLAMAGFGAKPRFGALLIAHVAPALYTTAPGHLFTRGQYLVVGLTPAVVISLAGALPCLTPIGGFFVVPLAIHFAGCIGDFAATARLLREPQGTLFEDIRDGIRFHRPSPH